MGFEKAQEASNIEMKTLWKIVKWAVIALVCLFIFIQLKRPARTNPPVDESQTIEAHTQILPQVKDILDRSCRDCHTNKTEWPWYTNVAPISTFDESSSGFATADSSSAETPGARASARER